MRSASLWFLAGCIGAVPCAWLASSAGAAPAAVAAPETEITVSTEAQYRAALTGLSANVSGLQTVVLDEDIEIIGAGDPTYSGSQPLRIDGQGHTLDGAGAHRHLVVTTDADLTIVDLSLVFGAAQGGGDGGAIDSQGHVLLDHVTLSENVAGGDGGAVHATGGLSVDESDIEWNRATGDGGAFSVSRASAPDDPAWLDGAWAGLQAPESRGDAIVLVGYSTIAGNEAEGSGGAISAGGAVWTLNSTLTANRAGVDGGAVSAPGTSMWLIYSTLEGNQAPAGAHVVTPRLRSTLSVLAGAIGGPGCAVDQPTDAESSYDTDGSCWFTGGGNTSHGSDPDLGVLLDNGGSTPTMAPNPGSPLIDAVSFPFRGGCLREITKDQRGAPRSAGAGCDIGAVEVAAVAPPDPAPPAPAPAPPPPTPAPPIAVAPTFTG